MDTSFYVNYIPFLLCIVLIKRESMNFIKNVKFGIKESTSGKNKLTPGKTIIGKKNLASSRIKLQKRKNNRKGILFSKISFRIK